MISLPGAPLRTRNDPPPALHILDNRGLSAGRDDVDEPMSKTYIAECKGCHHWVAAIVDHPCFTRKELAKTVADYIKDGYEVKIVDSDETQIRVHGCTCKPKQMELL